MLVCHHLTLSQIQHEFKRRNGGISSEQVRAWFEEPMPFTTGKGESQKGLKKRTTNMRVDSCAFH